MMFQNYGICIMLATQKGFVFTFFACANDGVSCDSESMLILLTSFIRGEQDYTAHTDTNHNTNSSRFQMVIGGNNTKTIGIYLIDSGLLKKAKTIHDLFIP